MNLHTGQLPLPTTAVQPPPPQQQQERPWISARSVVGGIAAAGTGLASLIGMWYALQAEIQEAKELPSLESLYEAEYPSRPEGYNWPRSYEQYKDQVGSLQEDMDDVFDKMDELEELIKELSKDIKDLERRKRDK